MKSKRSPSFRALFKKLPNEVKQQAVIAYHHFQNDPNYPALHFKKLNSRVPLWSVRIGAQYRAIGSIRGDIMLWIWIGSHAEYDGFLKHL